MEELIVKPRAVKYVYHVNDEYFTPEYLVTCLKPFLDDFFSSRKKSVWCSFDSKDSEFVRFFKAENYNVIHGTIAEGQDFLETKTPDEINLVCSNPPFSLKKKIFNRLIAERIPFALLMNLQAIEYQEIGNLFYEAEQSTGIPIQLIVPDKKVSFDGKTAAFCTGYVTWNFVDKTHFIHLPHNNSRDHYVPAYINTLK